MDVTGSFGRLTMLAVALAMAAPAAARDEIVAPGDQAGAGEDVGGFAREIGDSASEDGALGLARQREEAGDLTGATAILERYLLVDAESVVARAAYATLLCRLEDLQAGRIEVAKLSVLAVDEATAREVRAACDVAPSSEDAR